MHLFSPLLVPTNLAKSSTHLESKGKGHRPATTSSRSDGSVPDYIAEICAGLIDMAGRANLDMVAYLLGMARIEAELASKRARATQPRNADPKRP